MDNYDSMSTNIDDIIDPVLLNTEMREKSDNIIEHSPNLKQHNENTSNIQVNVEKVSNTDIFNERNLLLIFIILLAGLPHSNRLLTSIIPFRYQNVILINIIKAVLLFVIYQVVVRYIL